jgi:hypothetical protein
VHQGKVHTHFFGNFLCRNLGILFHKAQDYALFLFHHGLVVCAVRLPRPEHGKLMATASKTELEKQKGCWYYSKLKTPIMYFTA